MVEITDVLPKSRAEKAGILAGDVLLSINGKDINDILDYRFYLTNTQISLLLLRKDKQLNFNITKKEYDDIGLEFETPLMDKKHSCENKCVFCFIDQLPKGMRDTLYFKDDDSRLSFLHGNYVTLTNMSEKDIDRIIEMHISPVNISVHTTNPELRKQIMHNKRAGDVLSYLKRLADAGIALCCQIVLCKGLNDGEELDRSLHDLIAFYPALQSVAIVPAGLTRFRDGLYPLQPFTPDECAAVIRQIDAYGNWCKSTFGTRLFYPSDEFYINARLSLPDNDYYEDYSQIENGVGMITDMKSAVTLELEDTTAYGGYKPRTVSVATGYAAYEHICALAKLIEDKFAGIKINVYKIKNNFFGETITVSGLLTAKDMGEQLKGKELGEELFVPSSALRAQGDVFLDDISPDELSDILNVPITPASSEASDFLSKILGIN